jgi:AhpD family alkylhydroperoxidase
MSTAQIARLIASAAKENPAAFRLYRKYADRIWNSAVFSGKEKEIIATSVTHATKCSYCTGYHTKKAQLAGAGQDELVEGAIAAAAAEAAASYSREHGTARLRELLNSDNIEDLSPADRERAEFFRFPFQDGILPKRLKILIVLASSHVLNTADYISIAKEYAISENIPAHETEAAIGIASALEAGSAVRHLADISKAWEGGK